LGPHVVRPRQLNDNFYNVFEVIQKNDLLNTTMPEDYEKIEARIQDAIDAMKRENNQKITQFARHFNVPYQWL
jgi:arginine/ornithine N-succinyltransferase beta subunit